MTAGDGFAAEAPWVCVSHTLIGIQIARWKDIRVCVTAIKGDGYGKFLATSRPASLW